MAAKWQWRISSGSSSIDRGKYEREIQPRLPSVTVAGIAAALGVGEPYAADIRRGADARPHARHWANAGGGNWHFSG
jgi:hypothetical protein